jgi:hypothetical protein
MVMVGGMVTVMMTSLYPEICVSPRNRERPAGEFLLFRCYRE